MESSDWLLLRLTLSAHEAAIKVQLQSIPIVMGIFPCCALESWTPLLYSVMISIGFPVSTNIRVQTLSYPHVHVVCRPPPPHTQVCPVSLIRTQTRTESQFYQGSVTNISASPRDLIYHIHTFVPRTSEAGFRWFFDAQHDPSRNRASYTLRQQSLARNCDISSEPRSSSSAPRYPNIFQQRRRGSQPYQFHHCESLGAVPAP